MAGKPRRRPEPPPPPPNVEFSDWPEVRAALIVIALGVLGALAIFAVFH